MRIKFMKTKYTVQLCMILFVVFVAFGDMFLPQPLSGASKTTRRTINDFFLSFVPQKKFKNPNNRTEKAVDQFENGTGAK